MAIDTWIKAGAIYRDVRGHVARVSFTMGGDSGVLTSDTDFRVQAQAVVTALNAMTNAKQVGGIGILDAPTDPSQYGVSADYANVETKARLSFLGSDRLRSTTLSVPAPLVAIFFSGGTGDRETIDPANALVLALKAAMIGATNSATVTLGATPNTIHSLVIGRLVRAKVQRKIGKWTKDPTGVIPA
jgi:hypothetical protein